MNTLAVGLMAVLVLWHGDIAAAQAATPTLVAQADQTMTDGEVRKVDKDAKKVTIRHEEIKNLGMPPMTMVFQVRDAAVLEPLKPGDKVRFHVEQSGSTLVVTRIETAK